jgi:hypothetical protein
VFTCTSVVVLPSGRLSRRILASNQCKARRLGADYSTRKKGWPAVEPTIDAEGRAQSSFGRARRPPLETVNSFYLKILSPPPSLKNRSGSKTGAAYERSIGDYRVPITTVNASMMPVRTPRAIACRTKLLPPLPKNNRLVSLDLPVSSCHRAPPPCYKFGTP